MARNLRVKAVSLYGTSVPHSWSFPKGVTVIVGDSGGGKTSLLNLIKFGLGGSAPITNTLKEAAEGVSLDLMAGERSLTLHRNFETHKSKVKVSEGDRVLGEFAINNGQTRPWISSLLLESIGIPEVRVPTSRNSSSHRLTTISFQDVFAYSYLDQDSIDQETVNDRQPYGAGAKRPWTFELLHGIIDDEVATLEAEREEVAKNSEDRQQRIEAVEKFVEDVNLSSSESKLQDRLRELGQAESELQTRLEVAKAAAEQAFRAEDEKRTLQSQDEDELRSARIALSELTAELDEVRRAANQLERDLGSAREGEAAKRLLEPLPYLVCPRCEQDLENRPTREGHCVVCHQEDPPPAADEDSGKRQIEAQLEETRTLAVELEAAGAEARRRVDQLLETGRLRRAAIANATDSATAPFRAEILELQDRLGALRGERRTLSAGLPIEQAVKRERQEIASAAPRMSGLADKAESRRRELEPARERVEELSSLFSEILHAFSLPWLKVAEVDRESYLPLVNGLSLQNLSSGGMKTTTNVAYYLAVFVMGLRDKEILSPNFLMLDSIRKDSGSGAQDLARSDRIYTYLQTLQDLRGGFAPLAREFQILVVDNDLPAKFVNKFNAIRIDPTEPLIREAG